MEAMDSLSPENGATEVRNILIFWGKAKATRGGKTLLHTTFFMLEHVLELDHELVYILKGAINGSKADVSHIVQLVELLNHFLSNDYS